jgi:DNA mismatch repair ATPase MutS
MSSDDERVELLTGPNGSGKTFFEKDMVTAMLMAHATGFAPADSATMPVFDAIAYLDRVVDKEDLALSSHAQDLEYWKKLLNLLQTKRAVFASVDEAFSATSPSNQAAFTYGAITRFLQSANHYLMLSTHNHDLVDRLLGANTPLIRPYHFQFDVTQDKKVVFHYSKQEGHETSHALEVARTMGLPDEILSAASE